MDSDIDDILDLDFTESDQSTDESIDESTDESIDESTDESIDESTDESTDESIDESTDESIDESTDESIDESTDESMDESTDESIDESTDVSTDMNQQTIRSLMPSTSTGKTNPIMAVESETIYFRGGMVRGGLNPPSLTGKEKELVYAIQSINESVQPLISGLKESSVRILDIKKAHETLLNNLNLLDMPSKDLVDTFELLTASKNEILAKKIDEIERLLITQKAYKKIAENFNIPSFVDEEDSLREVSEVLQSIHDEQKAQRALLKEIQELSNTISKKLHVNYLNTLTV